MDAHMLNTIANFIWGIADDCLRDVYVRGKYRDVILPMTVIRRLDAVLEDTKPQVLEMKKTLDTAGITNQWGALCNTAGQAFCNASPFCLRDLTSRPTPQKLKADFEAYLDGFSPNVQEILDKFKFRNQIDTMIEADILGAVIQKFISKDINLSPKPCGNLPGLDNHAMGTIFEELVRRFNEANNEEAGEHWTPRDVVELMADLVFAPIADQIKDATYSCYDGACGTGGMLTVAQDRLNRIAAENGKKVSIHLFGQEIQPETYAIAKADMMLKGDGEEAMLPDGDRGKRLHAVRRSACGAFVRLYAGESSLRKELEDRCGAHGQRQEERNPRHPLQRRHRRWRAAFDDSPFLRWSAAVPAQQHQQDEAGYAAGQPHCRGA